MKLKALLLASALISSQVVFAETVKVDMHKISQEGIGESVGTITFSDSKEGLVIKPSLSNLPPGEHGFHIHENPDCGPKEKDGVMTAGQAAGPHYDPAKTGMHAGPGGAGHKGDLPILKIEADDKTSKEMTVSGVTVADIKNRSVMIHVGGDNYSDTPQPLGGGGARMACGVIK